MATNMSTGKARRRRTDLTCIVMWHEPEFDDGLSVLTVDGEKRGGPDGRLSQAAWADNYVREGGPLFALFPDGVPEAFVHEGVLLAFGHMEWHEGPWDNPQDGDEEFVIELLAFGDAIPSRRSPRKRYDVAHIVTFPKKRRRHRPRPLCAGLLPPERPEPEPEPVGVDVHEDPWRFGSWDG